MNIGHIQGGTHAGWRRVQQQPEDWTCTCGRQNRRYLVHCPDCKAPR